MAKGGEREEAREEAKEEEGTKEEEEAREEAKGSESDAAELRRTQPMGAKAQPKGQKEKKPATTRRNGLYNIRDGA